MSDLPRRTIADLLTRYDLEPELCDIFVEGQCDKEIISRVLHEAGQSSRIAYEIDSIEVPTGLVQKHGFTIGNKQRVIVLAHELKMLPENCSFRCLVDRDLDHWFGSMCTVKRLLWTDYCSLELYFFADNLLRDILVTTAKCRIDKWNEYSDSMISALRSLYIFRLVDRQFDLKMNWLNPDKCLSLKSGLVKLNQDEYIKRLLNKNNQSKELTNFRKCVDHWESKITGDHRLAMHGHDFIRMVVWSILQAKGIREFASEDVVTRLLVLLAPRARGILEVLV